MYYIYYILILYIQSDSDGAELPEHFFVHEELLRNFGDFLRQGRSCDKLCPSSYSSGNRHTTKHLYGKLTIFDGKHMGYRDT